MVLAELVMRFPPASWCRTLLGGFSGGCFAGKLLTGAAAEPTGQNYLGFFAWLFFYGADLPSRWTTMEKQGLLGEAHGAKQWERIQLCMGHCKAGCTLFPL